MSDVLGSKTYSPVFKFRSSPTMTTAVAVWTPTTSTRIVLTDLMVGNATYASGTVQIRFGNVGGDIIAEFVLNGSTTFGKTFSSPVYSPTYDRALFAEAGLTGIFNISASGFEQE